MSKCSYSSSHLPIIMRALPLPDNFVFDEIFIGAIFHSWNFIWQFCTVIFSFIWEYSLCFLLIVEVSRIWTQVGVHLHTPSSIITNSYLLSICRNYLSLLWWINISSYSNLLSRGLRSRHLFQLRFSVCLPDVPPSQVCSKSALLIK
jgi:hypothetical protein